MHDISGRVKTFIMVDWSHLAAMHPYSHSLYTPLLPRIRKNTAKNLRKNKSEKIHGVGIKSEISLNGYC